MTNSSLNAWLLHKRGSGDSSLRLTLFTQEQGIIHCLYKGARTAKKSQSLQPFTPLWVSVKESHQWVYVRQLETKGPAIDLQGSALFSGLYLNELLYHALKPADTHEQLFTAYQASLKHLSLVKDQQALERQLRRFESVLLDHCGYALTYTEDARTFEKINPDKHYLYTAGEGFTQSTQGLSGTHLLAIANDNLDHPDTLKTAKFIMRKAIDHFLDGREIKSRALFQPVEIHLL